ncbi:Ig-like domain-containing protein [Kitasatospora sp. NPDC096147]|uniref:Ig-like domain-containing protein n=1 Tax=Kitasatospora sp. NPDC096147 TaxID=3364093 RepID=UPI00380DC70B
MRYRERLSGLLVALLAAATLATPTNASALDATAKLGNTTTGTATDSGDSNHLNASRYVMGSKGGQVTSISVFVGDVGAAPNNQYQVAVYGDVGGKPGPLVANSAAGTLTANSWNSLPVSANLSPNTAYWLAYNSNGVSQAVNNLRYSTGGKGAYSNSSTAYGSWPASFGPSTTTGLDFSINATYTVANTPVWTPGAGPGASGPVLVVTTAANPYSKYLGEILEAEGLNSYKTVDLSQVNSLLLTQHSLVLLGETPLTDAQVTMFSNWTSTGGRLVAMRPDKKLAPLLGLTASANTLADAYLKIDTSAAPGAGLTADTMGFHGAADRYALNGATAVATLYGDATTATANPAVTLRTVGSGQAAAFTFDLARSVVQTRQGNAAWAGQQRDGVDGYEASEMFFGGNGQADWNDLDKALIPIADEQQRLLANLVTRMNLAKAPLPRFWYFPRDVKAVVVMTGDDHGVGGTSGRWDNFIGQSPAGCKVENWECVRGSSYLYSGGPLTAAQAQAYSDEGFEVGSHITTDCRPWGTTAALQSMYTSQLNDWKAKYPALPTPSSSRTHCVEWDDWATQAKTKLANGIRMDHDYYYYPSSFVNDRPGYFNGTGLPMKFADTDGSVIDVYQATTQITDESGQSHPGTINTLLNAAYGAQGYYAAVTANIHTDFAPSQTADQIIAAAKAKGVPVVSSRQLLNWLDGRNGSAYSGISWNGTTLSFSITGGVNGLRGMLPVQASNGTLLGIKQAGVPVPYRVETVKGVNYAFFNGNAGSYTATYGQDTTRPTVTGTTPANGATAVPGQNPVRFAFSEPLDGSSVGPTDVTVVPTAGGAAVSGTVSYDSTTNGVVFTQASPLAVSTSYRATVQGVRDVAGNTLAAPYAITFTTAAPPPLTVGNAEIGTQEDDNSSNHLNGSRFVTGASAITLKQLSVHVGSVSAAPNNQYQLAVYTDVDGVPGTLVASTPSGTLTADSWNSLPVNLALSAGTAYWLVYNTNGTGPALNNMHYNVGSYGVGAYQGAAAPFGTWPASFGAANRTSLSYSLFGTY